MPSFGGGGSHGDGGFSGGGSHSGGGGSHYSGGSHSHGPDDRDRHGPHDRPPHHRHSTIIIGGGHYGRRYYDDYDYEDRGGTRGYGNSEPTKYSLFQKIAGILMAIAIVLIVVFAVVKEAFNPLPDVSPRQIEEDFVYYQSMIANAPASQIVEGTITSTPLNFKCGKYYFTYEFTHPRISNYTCTGYIYSVFTKEEIEKYRVGDTIDIVVELTDNLNADSVPVVFKDFSLEDDGEYLVVKGWSTATTIAVIVLVGVFALCFVIIIVNNVKNRKLQRESGGARLGDSASSSSTTSQLRKCSYCGTIIPSGKTSCPNCGSGKNKY